MSCKTKCKYHTLYQRCNTQEDEVTDRQYYKQSSHCLFLTDDCNGFLIALIFMGYCCFLLVFYEL